MANKTAEGSNDLLIARVKDAVSQTLRRQSPSFVGFLTEQEAAAILQYVESSAFAGIFGRDVRYCFFGGYDNAERQMFAALPEWASDASDISFPITALRFSHRPEYELSHRDYLGALMSLGLVRAKIGDIIVDESGAIVISHSDVADHIISQLDKIGRVGVTVEKTELDDITVSQSFEDIRATVASDRIDCVTAALIGTSRERAREYITSKLVFINGIECMSVDKRVKAGDAVTVRKKGKFLIDSVSDVTKKGRLILIARKKN